MAQYLCIWVRAYWFSVTSFSKWLPGGHIRFFGFWTAWFRQCNSSLLSNFSFKFHVHILCGCRQKTNDCQLCRFQNICLVILNNVQLQSTHCPLPPTPMGVLVDHWSTISGYGLMTTYGVLDLGWHLLLMMACCLTAPNHYRNHRGVFVSKILWNSISKVHGFNVLQKQFTLYSLHLPR